MKHRLCTGDLEYCGKTLQPSPPSPFPPFYFNIIVGQFQYKTKLYTHLHY